jgi:hypothetical protein
VEYHAEGAKPGTEFTYGAAVGKGPQLVEVNEKICHLRPVQAVKDEKELEALKKKLQRQFSPRWKKK